MILILTSIGDASSDLVVDWLDYLKHKYVRINSYDLFEKKIVFSLQQNDTSIVIDNKKLDIEAVNVVWFRKFGYFEDSDFFEKISKLYGINIVNHISKEFYKILYFFLLTFKYKHWLTNPFKLNLNKLDVLRIASMCGFNTPNSSITNEMSAENTNMIVKSVYDPLLMNLRGSNFLTYTNLLITKDMNEISNVFFPSLIQTKIEKKYEVRVFYLMGKCYAMAIFSQNDDQTKIDFRKYNWNNPNRFLPYQLPRSECFKIGKLMKEINLNCGSIDLIKAHDDKYYFLEVNPTGQFGMVDFPCNYGLHYKVAKTLINLDK
jgi:ATP-GRASP peptide maturase of grasp-with-spasm system